MKKEFGARVLIDAHGPDHGLRVAIVGRGNSRLVEIKEFAQACEPNERGGMETWLHVAHVELSKLLDPKGKHRDCYSGDTPGKGDSVQHSIISAAIAYLAYWGGEAEYLDDDSAPCEHFGMYWGRHQRQHRLGCETCGEYSVATCDCHKAPAVEAAPTAEAPVNMGGEAWVKSPAGQAWAEETRKARGNR